MHSRARPARYRSPASASRQVSGGGATRGNGSAWPFTGVRWSISYAALLLYVITIVTYTIPFGEVIMATAILALPLERRLRFPGILIVMAVLVIWAFTSQFSSPWPQTVMGETINLGKVLLIALVAACTLNHPARIRLFMFVFLAAFALYPVRGTLVNFFIGGYTLVGRALWNFIFSNPNDLAGLTLLQLSMACAYFSGESKGWTRTAAVAGIIILPLIILLTQSRGAFVGLLIFAVMALAGQLNRGRVLGGMTVVLLAAALIVPSSAWDRLGMVRQIGSGGAEVLGELDDQGSAETRFAIWQTAARVVADHPITGIGWGAYPQANVRYSPSLGAVDSHSTYMTLAAELGFPGLLLFLAMVAAALIGAERARRRTLATNPTVGRQLRLLSFGLLAFLAAGVFASYAHLTFLYLHLILIWALGQSAVQGAPVARRRGRINHYGIG